MAICFTGEVTAEELRQRLDGAKERVSSQPRTEQRLQTADSVEQQGSSGEGEERGAGGRRGAGRDIYIWPLQIRLILLMTYYGLDISCCSLTNNPNNNIISQSNSDRPKINIISYQWTSVHPQHKWLIHRFQTALYTSNLLLKGENCKIISFKILCRTSNHECFI